MRCEDLELGGPILCKARAINPKLNKLLLEDWTSRSIALLQRYLKESFSVHREGG